MALCNWLSIAIELIAELFDEGEARVRRAVVQKSYRSVPKFQYTSRRRTSQPSAECPTPGAMDLTGVHSGPFDFVRDLRAPIMVPMSSPVAELASPDVISKYEPVIGLEAVSYTHLRAHENPEHLVCRLLL